MQIEIKILKKKIKINLKYINQWIKLLKKNYQKILQKMVKINLKKNGLNMQKIKKKNVLNY